MGIGLDIGAVVTRGQLNERFGGGIQGGMLTPAGGQYMFLFSDNASGKRYGYDTDGWADESYTKYLYTGEGTEGHQSIDRRKNKILLESIHSGREVHLFYAVGTVSGSSEKRHEYLGQFEVDATDPWSPVTTLDINQEPRTAVLFNLNRVSGTGPTKEVDAVVIDAPVGEATVVEVDSEASDNLHFERRAVEPSRAERRERQLENGLNKWLQSKGKAVRRLRIGIPGEPGHLYTDTWVPSTKTLYEVKSDATRNDIRMAVAQLQDYRRHISPAPESCVVVVPIRPSDDLLQFVESCGLNLAVFESTGLNYLVGKQ